jgi:predicted permease
LRQRAPNDAGEHARHASNAAGPGTVQVFMTTSDVRLVVRGLVKRPGFTATVVLTLALAIGANTAVFSLVNDVLFRELPVRAPGELILFRNVEGRDGRISRAGENNGSVDPVTGRPASTSFSVLTFERLRSSGTALSHVFAFAPFNRITLIIDGHPETTDMGQYVSGDYFAGLGVSAIAGRTLTDADDQLAAPPVGVISDRFWERRFNRNLSVIGRTILVNGVPITLAGVTPPGFAGTMQIGESVDLYLPLALHARFQPDRGVSRAQPWYWWIRIMGRLDAGVTAEQARARLEPIFQQTAREGWLAGHAREDGGSSTMPEMSTLASDPGGQGESDRRRSYADSLRILMGLAGVLLLLASANVANLLVARGSGRRREMALRLALGASRARIVRQLLGESLVLAFAGSACGILLAYWSRGLLLGLRQFNGDPAVLNLPLDGRVLAFTIFITAGTALLFGLPPAFRASRVDLTTEFQSGGRLLGTRERSRLGQMLMVVQIALSLVLLVGAGLFVQTLRNLEQVSVGFNTQGLALFRIEAAPAGYAPESFTTLQSRLQDRLAQIPGVRAATYSRVPLLAGTRANRRTIIPGYTAAGASVNININGVAPNFFTAMEIPLLLGRSFTTRDDERAPKVAIVTAALARRYFAGESPVGRRIEFSASPNAPATEIEIVGVARDAKYTTLREAEPVTIYLPAPQMLEGVANFSVRTAGDPAAIGSAIRAAVHDIDPTLPVTDFRTQAQQIERRNSQELMFAKLSSFFGVAALILACLGLYGLMWYLVVQRTGEMGLRLALGALPGQVLRMVLRESLTLVGIGLVLGVAIAYGVRRFVESMLFGLTSTDPLTYAVVAGLLVVVALLAALRPAQRAARVDPVIALRAE